MNELERLPPFTVRCHQRNGNGNGNSKMARKTVSFGLFLFVL
jgi:hypothetical protein